MTDSDLHFIVTFAEDGSVWDSETENDQFKRVYKMNPKTLELHPTSSYNNTFMPGEDEMPVGEIKKSFAQWLARYNPQGFKIKWRYI